MFIINITNNIRNLSPSHFHRNNRKGSKMKLSRNTNILEYSSYDLNC